MAANLRPKKNFCGPNSNQESASFRYFGCISSGFCYHAARKAYNFGKIFKLRPKDQFGFATPDLKDMKVNFFNSKVGGYSGRFKTIML
jgi:hypothetical protein